MKYRYLFTKPYVFELMLIQKVLSKFHLKVLIFQQKAKKAFEPPRFLVE